MGYEYWLPFVLIGLCPLFVVHANRYPYDPHLYSEDILGITTIVVGVLLSFGAPRELLVSFQIFGSDAINIEICFMLMFVIDFFVFLVGVLFASFFV